MKKTISVLFLFVIFLTGSALASKRVPDMPRILANARFVYVTAYDGSQFDPNLLPEDRAAIGRVQEAIQKWGKLMLVYRPEDADIILVVESRPSEDVLAVYDAHSPHSETYLWRVMACAGLQKGEVPLVSEFKTAWEKITD
jgi:hypothetical protein